MNIFTRITSLAAGLMLAATAWADVPFKATTVTDGEFAAGTTWYTMTIGAANLLISDNNGAESIALGGEISADDANLWCFVGDDTNGYKIYNKQAGATKALAAPTTMSESNGGSSYAILKDVDNLESGYTNLWDFAAATQASDGASLDVEDGWYINEHGYSGNILNNRDSKLAFWSAGYDNGSAIVITATAFAFSVDLENGEFTSSNAAKSYSGVWSSTATDPQLTLSCAVNSSTGVATNNMAANSDKVHIDMYPTAAGLVYTLSAGSGYIVTGYSFKFVNVNSGQTGLTIAAGDKTATVSDEEQAIEVSGLEEQTAAYTLTGALKPIKFYDFVVTVEKSFESVESQTNLFVTDGTQTTPYRIPAIAKTHDGGLLALTDYRPGGADVGSGHVNIVGKISSDNGVTWGEEFAVVTGSGVRSQNDYGYGDAALVADSESGNVLLMCASGHIGYGSSTRTNPIRVTRLRSSDNGKTWTTAEDVTETIYGLLDNAGAGKAQAIFFSSGRICQSKIVKTGGYYRLYSAICTRPAGNYVVYSDDLGATWNVLGGVSQVAVPGGDEAKCEELPDGTVVVSSRTTGGRYFNLFTYSDQEKGEGQWATKAFSGKDNNGVKALSNACNGEIMILPAVRNSDNEEVYVALQSVPFGSERTNVGIYYKELAEYADFSTPDNLAAEWDGKHQASHMSSAYSTMTVQANDSIAFYYEESTFGKDYTEVYKQYSLYGITDGKYTYNPNIDREAFLKKIQNEEVSYRAEELKTYGDVECGTAVGMVEESKKDLVSEAVDKAVAAYTANPTDEAYEEALATINDAIAGAAVKISATEVYTLENKERTGKYLSVVTDGTTFKGVTTNDADEQKFFFVPSSEEGKWLLCNQTSNVYLGPTQAIYVSMQQETEAGDAGIFTVSSGTDGWSVLLCENPVNSSIPAVHLAGEGNLVEWYADSDGSLWRIVPTGEEIKTDIQLVENAQKGLQLKYYDLQGRRLTAAPATGIYITSDKKKHIK